MNLPNRLTLARLVLTAMFVLVMSLPGLPWANSIGLLLFSAASITDYLDGSIARKRGLVTTFGKLMDPLADKILMVSAFVILADRDLIPAWAAIVILTREFLVTGLRLVATSKGTVLAADSLGKQKTIYQIVAAVYFLVVLAAPEPLFSWLRPLVTWKPMSPGFFGVAILSLAVLLTVVSGISYLVKNRDLIRDA